MIKEKNNRILYLACSKEGTKPINILIITMNSRFLPICLPAKREGAFSLFTCVLDLTVSQGSFMNRMENCSEKRAVWLD